MIATSIQLALRQLRVNALRSALTVLGIVIGIASVVARVSLGSAVQASIDDNLSGLGADTLSITPGASAQADTELGGGGRLAAGGTSAAGDPLTDDDVAAVAAVPGVTAAVPVVQQPGEVTLGTTEGTTVMATTSELAEVESFAFAAGGWFSPLTDEAGLPVAVLGATLVEDLGLTPAQAIDAEVTVDGRAFTVVGVLDPVGGVSFVSPDDAVVLPLDTARQGVVDDAELTQVRVGLSATTPEVLDAVEQALRTSRGIEATADPDFTVTDAGSITDIAEETTSLLTTLITAIGAISLVVGAIGIANMMLVAVRERTREIGVRRAVGATRGDITTQFLVEAIVLSLVGGVIGAVGGVGLSTVVASSLLGVAAVVSGTAVVVALGVSMLVGVAAGLGPAWQAASIDPTTALRYE